MVYEIKIVRTIENVDKKQWDELTSFYFMKSNILEIVENLELGKEAFYLLLYYKDTLVGSAVAYGQNNDALYSTLDETLFGKFSSLVRPFFGLNKSLICYCPYSPTYKMYAFKEGFETKEAFSFFLDALHNLANENNYVSCAIIGILKEELALLPKNNYYSFFSGFKVRIPVLWKSFDEYASSLKKSHRAIVRKERRLFEGSQYKVEYINFIETQKNLVESFFNKNLEKYGAQKDKLVMNKNFIDALLNTKHSNASFFIGRKNQKIISALMFVEDQERFISFRIGQDEVENNGFSFFNLSIYEPIRVAIEKNKKFIELGTGNYQYKIRRGGELEEYYQVINITSKFKRLYLQYVISILSKLNKKKHLNRLD